MRQRQRVAERDQVRRPLRGEDAGDAGGLERIALGDASGANFAQRLWRNRDCPPGHCLALRDGFGADVDHPDTTASIDV
jgi:hypothetical protein